MFLAFSFLIFVLHHAFTINCGTELIHNATYGIYHPSYSLDFMDHPRVPGSLLRVKEIDVVYPVPNPWVNREEISFISVEDRLGAGNGACSYIKAGGVGCNYTTIHLISQRNHGIDSIIRIYTSNKKYPDNK